jgi:transglutaminase-like putative cysteine protease
LAQEKQSESLLDSPEITACLETAGDNRDELVKAINNVPAEQREALRFLILNMPKHDLKNLSADFLLTNIEYAFQARAQAPWKIPDDVFLNDVLPYSNIDEPRDPWREEFFKLCQPIVKDCKTPAEAAQKLNETIFKELAVKYSTARKRANQSPKESIEQGLASCTGLSIILSDACRSVGVPARLAGIPSWKNKRGNHTWVEVWDQDWHFTGAAEPNPNGLNHTWFQGDAALADPDSKMHSIYATSFGKTETVFPMVWSPEKRVYAENVTARYIPANSKTKTGVVNVMIRVWNVDQTEREVVDVIVEGNDEKKQGKSKGGTADMNDMLTFELKPESKYCLKLTRPATDEQPALEMAQDFVTSREPNQLVSITLQPRDDDEKKADDPATSHSALSAADSRALSAIADDHFFDLVSANELLLTQPDSVRALAWSRYLISPMGQKRKSDFKKNQVTFQKHISPYTIKEVGTRPEGGWPLFIAMHGGGGAPQKLNDSQWRHMQIYYKDQSQVTGYKYLALRAPNNTWNGFYDDYVYPLIENLIQQCVVFGDVDPNRVFIMGYSHGGYGAFAIGPKIPFRFAAVHSSAAAPTDGQTSAKTLRNTRFTFMVGEKDTAYGRRERCERFAKQVKELQSENEGDYPVEFMFKEGFGHGGLPDRDMIGEMYDHVRNPAPKHVTWEQTDSVVKRFFWLAVDKPARGQMIDAKIDGNTIEVKTEKCNSFSIFLDQRLIDPNQPVVIKMGETEYKVDYKPSFKTLCESIADTGDINLSFDFEIKINVEE